MLGGLFGRSRQATAPGMAGQRPAYKDALLLAGAGLMGDNDPWGSAGAGFATGMIAGREKQAEAAKRNKTLEMARKIDPQLAQFYEAGLLDGPTLGKAVLQAQRPKTDQFTQMSQEEVKSMGLPAGNYQKGPNNKIYPIGGGGTSLSVDADGKITFNQGHINNNSKQDIKNAANRVSDAQDLAAVGADLKQTVSILRTANENVGYSGVGGNIVGTVLDTAEQAGVPIAGTSGARKVMTSGSLDVALRQVQKTKGAISNAEMKLFMNASPGLTTTQAGNAALLNMLDAIADRQILRVTEMEKWRLQNGTLDGFEEDWNIFLNENPIITPDMFGLEETSSGTSSSGATSTGVDMSNMSDEQIAAEIARRQAGQ